MKWEPKDIIALVALCILGALIGVGRDSLLIDIFTGIIVVYVGIDITLVRRRLK